jgi:Rap1a immunity proteins
MRSIKTATLATATLAALLGLQSAWGHAQVLDKPDPTVSAYLPGCRAYLEDVASEGAGSCSGAIDALLYIGELLAPDYRFCVPLQVPRREVIAGIVEDIDALQPEANRQDFKGMVLSILRYRWPCRE